MTGYTLIHPIGEGGHGTVWEASKRLPDGQSLPVACKILRASLHGESDCATLFVQEGMLSMQLTHNHPNLVTVYDCFQDALGQLCLIMELVRGCSLRNLMASRTLPLPVVCRVGMDVLQALAHLHTHGVLHRDISPCNILISTSGEVKVSDLGVAKVLSRGHARSSNIRGKIAYASPEEIGCSTLDPRSDLFSLGVVLYELLSGQSPFPCGDHQHPVGVRLMNTEAAPLPGHLPIALRELVMGLLIADPAQRSAQTAEQALALLQQCGIPPAPREALAALVAPLYRERAQPRPGLMPPARDNKPDEAAMTIPGSAATRPKHSRGPVLVLLAALLIPGALLAWQRLEKPPRHAAPSGSASEAHDTCQPGDEALPPATSPVPSSTASPDAPVDEAPRRAAPRARAHDPALVL